MSDIPHYDLLIRGGTVIDGSKAPRFDADVGVIAGRIAAIGDLAGHSADRTLEAAGRIVAPGFIDSHTHDDQAVLSQAAMPFKISQGVTTVVAGNCGISAAPLRADMDLPMPLSLIDTPAEGRFTT
ncbi:MAG: D-aminoacylase, partial [Variovorax sp.]